MNVLCVGALLADFVARVTRHPGADDEVFVPELEMAPGGSAANTAVGLARLGASVGFMGRVGRGDPVGKGLVQDLVAEGVDVECVVEDAAHHTGMVYVAVDLSGDRRMYAYSGAANELSERDINWDAVGAADVVYLASLKNIDAFVALARWCREHDKPVVANPGMLGVERPLGELLKLVGNLDVLILSEPELELVAEIARGGGNPSGTTATGSPLEFLSVLFFSEGLKTLVVTRGKAGVEFTQSRGAASKQARSIPSFPVPVKDTTGAGDAFSAGFLFQYSRENDRESGESLRKCCQFGSAVAAHAIQQYGARNGLPAREDVESFLNSRA
ncbi:MAG: carbohydrate kinase family protein [Promethearchaeota archaeon]